MAAEDFMTIKELGDRFPQEWISNKGLVPYIKRHGENLVGLEIGTCRGESTYYFLDKCPNISKLYTVDPYTSYEDWVGTISQEDLDKHEAIAKENLKKFGDRVEMSRVTSLEFSSNSRTEQFDFIFVDGDHSYDATLADCVAFYPLLKKGGIFCGHDYQSIEAVKRAVDDFREKHKITAPINLSLNSAFFWNK